MNYSNYRFTLDIQKNKAQASIPVHFGDTGNRFYIALTDGGNPYIITDGCRVDFYAKKPNPNSAPLVNSCIIENNSLVRYDFNTNTADQEGIHKCELRLYSPDGRLITTPSFIMVVDQRVVYDDEIVTDEESAALNALGIIASEQARFDAENARVEAEASRRSAEESRVAAEEARATAENNRDATMTELIETTNKAIGDIKADFKNINTDSIVVGQGEAADLSIAGGTTNISEYGEKAGLSYTEIASLTALLLANGGIKKSVASAPLSIALGLSNESTKSGAVTLGYGNKNAGFNSTAIGALNNITGDSAFADGYKNTVNGDFGTAFGQENTAGTMALVGGVLSKATGKGSLAFGNECKATDEYAVAIGGDNTASGKRSFAAGNNSKATKDYAVALGDGNTASGKQSFATGVDTEATASASFSEGTETHALHGNSHAGGLRTKTGRDNQFVVGQYNKVSNKALFIVGDGSSDTNRTNIFECNDDGTAYLNGKPIATEEFVREIISIPKTETWTFTLADGSTVTKEVYIG